MPVLLALFALAATILFWTLRAHVAARAVQELNRDTKPLQRRVGGAVERLIGTPLERVRDPRLAATILMIQLVRTGSPVTAAEKTRILELMEQPLGVRDISGQFERAWAYTRARAFFSAVADQLTPMLREKLEPPERLQLIDMLKAVANAYGEASDLQTEAIARLKTRLMRV